MFEKNEVLIMINFYEVLTDLKPDMSLNEIHDELIRQEKVWIKRQINNPEKATKMLAYLFDAKKAFETEETRKEYDCQLAKSKQSPTEVDSRAEAIRQHREWIDKAIDFLENQNQKDLALQAYEKALSFYRPDTATDSISYLVGAMIYERMIDFRAALDCINQGLLLSPKNTPMHEIKIRDLLILAMQEADNSNGRNLGSLNSYYQAAEDAIQQGLSIAHEDGEANYTALFQGAYAKLIFYAGTVTKENQQTALNLAKQAQEGGAPDMQQHIDSMESELNASSAQDEYIAQLTRNAENIKNGQQTKKQTGNIGMIAFVVSVVLSYLTAGTAIGSLPLSFGSLIAAAGIGFFCYTSNDKSGPVVASILWTIVFSFTNSTKLYTHLGYSAYTASVVMSHFKFNVVFLILVAVVSKYIGKIHSSK